MKTYLLSLLGVLGVAMAAPVWAKPVESVAEAPVISHAGRAEAGASAAAVPVVSHAGRAEAGAETPSDEVADQDAAADAALIDKAEKQEVAEAEARDFCNRTSELGHQRLADQKAECASMADDASDEQKAMCQKASKCVLLAAIDATEGKGTEQVPHAARAEAGYVAPSTQTPAQTGATRLGAYALNDEPTDSLIQPAVMRDDEAVVDTALATGEDRDLTVEDAGYATDALASNQIPNTRDKVENAQFYLSYCREQGYPETVCATAVTTMDKESAFNSSADNSTSSAYGLGQYINATWAAECQRYLQATASACNALRGNPKAQTDVLMASINDRFEKYQSGALECRNLDFAACNYAVYHYAGSWGGQVNDGLSYYNSTFNATNNVYLAAANSLGTNPTEIAQLSLMNVGNYLPSNYFSSGSGSSNGGSNINLASLTQNPAQAYANMLAMQVGYGQPMGMTPYTIPPYNPYALAYGGIPVPGSAPTQLPIIVVSGDTTTLVDDAAQGCGGQVIDVESDVGLIRGACVEYVADPLDALVS